MDDKEHEKNHQKPKEEHHDCHGHDHHDSKKKHKHHGHSHSHYDSKHLLRELIIGGEKPLHKPRKDLHEDSHLHPHHKQTDHVRHHHHIAHHHGKETMEEAKFVNKEIKLHQVEKRRESFEDATGSRMLNRISKVSAAPGQMRDAHEQETASATPARKKGIKVKQSSSKTVNDRLNSIRLRIAFARARALERGMTFGV